MASRTRTRGRKAVVGAALVACLVTLVGGSGLLLDRAAEAWYLRRLDSPDFETALAAARRLGELHSAKAVPQIIRLITRAKQEDENALRRGERAPKDFLEDLPEVNRAIAEDSNFLMCIGQGAFNARKCRTWRTIRVALREIGAAAVPALLAVHRSRETPYVERELVTCELFSLLRELARRADARALLRLAGAPDLEEPFRVQAFAALAELPVLPDEALPFLLQGLQSDVPQVRIHAARALGSMGSRAREAVPALEELKTDGRHYLWEAANDALKNIQRDS